MKSSIALVILCFSTALTTYAEKDYPLKVQLLESTWDNDRFGTAHGYGRGNVIDAESTRGFDFNYDCQSSYNTTTGNTVYLGRWKKEQQRLIIQGTQIGGQHKSECEMKVTLQTGVYVKKNTQLFLVTQDQFQSANEDLHPADKDQTHYPMKVSILSANWQAAALGSVGTGKGNIVDGDQTEGFNFASNCAITFQSGVGLYFAKWKEEKSKLILLTKTIGENQFHTCQLKIDLIGGAYVRNTNSGVINKLSHDEFKAFLSKRRETQAQAKEAAAANPLPPGGSGASSAAKTKVNLASTPDGADIEMDGKYVGSTPSLLEWPTGEHSVTIRKPGYRVWTRTMTLVAGEIRVNANLEKDVTK